MHVFENLSPQHVGPHDLSFSAPTGWVCSAVGDDGLAVVCVVIGTEEVVPTEA